MNTSRRSFFKAAAAVAGIGIMPKFANASVPQKWDAEYDVVVIGFGGAGATFADIELFSRHIGPNVKMKAAGGISSLEEAKF